jgi:ophiobolin F synthase
MLDTSKFPLMSLVWSCCMHRNPGCQAFDFQADFWPTTLARLWHGLVTFGCAITIPEEEEALAEELIKPALAMASLVNDLYSFEKERNDANVQNAILVVMREHRCSEANARDIMAERIRVECAKYVRNVKETLARTDVSVDLKRYIEVMQYTLSGNVIWSTQCPRYNMGAKWNDLQMRRAKHGVAEYPSRWPGDRNGANGTIHDDAVLAKGADGLKRKRNDNRNGSDRNGNTNGSRRAKRMNSSMSSEDALVLEDVVSLALDSNLPDLSADVSWPCSICWQTFSRHENVADSDRYVQVVLQPYQYVVSLPSKGFRDQAIDSINTWLKVPLKTTKIIKMIIGMLHNSSLMYVSWRFGPTPTLECLTQLLRLDDLEDNSPLRRGSPSTHCLYGPAQTINSATYHFTQATSLAANLSNPAAFLVFQEEVQQLFIGQSYDIYWTHNALCPSVAEYLKMVDQKTGGLFRMLTRMMVAESPVMCGSDNDDHDDDAAGTNSPLDALSCLVGRFFQVRDDYQNLASADYAKQKGFAEDLDEGKYSFALIHCVQTLDADAAAAGDAMKLRALLMKRRCEGKLSNEAKREVLGLMKKTRSLEYTLRVLRALHAELEREINSLEAEFGEKNFSLRLMMNMLKV